MKDPLACAGEGERGCGSSKGGEEGSGEGGTRAGTFTERRRQPGAAGSQVEQVQGVGALAKQALFPVAVSRLMLGQAEMFARFAIATSTPACCRF